MIHNLMIFSSLAAGALLPSKGSFAAAVQSDLNTPPVKSLCQLLSQREKYSKVEVTVRV
jgi:hypothetical protein